MIPNHKTPQQVAAYVSEARGNVFASDMDRRMVLGFLSDSERFLEVAQKPYEIDAEEGLTAEQFKQWYADGIAAGDVVKFREIDGGGEAWEYGIAAFKHVEADGKPQISPVIAFKVSDGQLIQCDDDMLNLVYLRPSEGEYADFVRMLAEDGWAIDERKGGLRKIELPRPYDLVAFDEIGGKGRRGIGIVHGKASEGNEGNKGKAVGFCCYVIFGPSVKGKPEEVCYAYPPRDAFRVSEWRFTVLAKDGDASGNVARRLEVAEGIGGDGSVEGAEGISSLPPFPSPPSFAYTNGKSALNRLNRELGRYGKVWNGFQKRVEPLERRMGGAKAYVKAGERYWYVDDTLNVAEAEYRDTRTHRYRILSGNGWKRKKDAEEFQMRLKDVLRADMAR